MTAIGSDGGQRWRGVDSVTIPLCEPHLGGHEWKYVKECLDTGWVSTVGRFVTRFEEEIAARLGARYAVATVNGTSALHIALLLAGVGRGRRGAGVDADVHRAGQRRPLRRRLARVHRRRAALLADGRAEGGRFPRARMPVHARRAAQPSHRPPRVAHYFRSTCSAIRSTWIRCWRSPRATTCTVIEDATEALGAHYRDQRRRPPARPGSHVACLSFNGNKLITTGGGGMLVTDDEAFARRARYLTTQAKDDPVEYVHHEIGYNYRLTNLQAALGVAQLERLDGHVEAKRRIARATRRRSTTCAGLDVMREASWARSAFWMYTVLVHARCAASRAGVCSPCSARRASRRGRCGSRCTCPPRIAAPTPSTAASPSACTARPSACRVRSACPTMRRPWSSRRSPHRATGGAAAAGAQVASWPAADRHHLV